MDIHMDMPDSYRLKPNGVSSDTKVSGPRGRLRTLPRSRRCSPESPTQGQVKERHFTFTFGKHTESSCAPARGIMVRVTDASESATLAFELDLVIIYHCCECSLEVSKQVLDLHYTLRSADSFAVYFKDRCFDKKIELALNTALIAPLATRTLLGDQAVYLRLLDPDPKNFFFNDIVRTFMMVFDLWQYEEGTWPGFVIIIDMDQATMSHVAKLEVMVIKKVLYYVQECLPIKLKEVHFRNAPYFMDKLMMLLRPFLKKALLDIIYIHPTGSSSLDNFVPREAFPKEDGGKYKLRETIKEETTQRLQANEAFFREESKKRVNESLRPGGRTALHDMFSVQGSFKKLNID